MWADHLKQVFLLTKPGIIFGNSVTALGGFALSSQGMIRSTLCFALFQGLMLIIASACICNNLIDCNLDQKMVRTRKRPLPSGAISPQLATFLAVVLGGTGSLILGIYTNLLTLFLALAGFFLYVCVYTFSKYKTCYGTWIGTLSGALPPVIGYTAFSHRIDLAASLLFLMIIFWQMPHFYAIGLFRIEDYRRGNIPIMPLQKGVLRTKIEMIGCCFGLVVTLALFLFFYPVKLFSFSILLILALCWWLFSIRGLTSLNDHKWARQMFFFSLAIVLCFAFFIPLSSFR